MSRDIGSHTRRIYNLLAPDERLAIATAALRGDADSVVAQTHLALVRIGRTAPDPADREWARSLFTPWARAHEFGPDASTGRGS